MRLEAPRARDVVAGSKTLELTEGPCKKRGLTLVGEAAVGADAKSCVIGAVTLGEGKIAITRKLVAAMAEQAVAQATATAEQSSSEAASSTQLNRVARRSVTRRTPTCVSPLARTGKRAGH